MKAGRFAVSIVAAAALVPLSAAAAVAAPPANDTPDGAVVLSLGDTYNEDTSQATTDDLDARLNQVCGAPFTNASVWFTYTPDEDGAFLLDMSQSSYTGGFMVFKGTPTQRHMIGCGPTEVAVEANAGVTYSIVAFSDTKKNGGDLVLALEEGPPPPTVSATIDPTGTVLPKGKASVSGTFTCTNADFIEIDGQLRQIWQRVKINGYFTKFMQGDVCDGKKHAWSRVVTSHNGTYAPGDATMRIFTGACGLLECTGFNVRGHVMLSKGSPKSVPQGAWNAGVSHPFAPLTSKTWPTS